MWCYRRLLKVPWTEKKTNKEIIQMVDVGERLLQQLMKRKLRYAGHIMQLGTFTTTISRGDNRREERTGKAKKELDGRCNCKGMVRVDRLWRYETEGRKQRRMERHGCQPSDQRRHLLIIRH
ncbi:endonuclease-reverse transcriptase [Elysia marginata]|uniref:Endonuclease-reverse transcriptase n=1 Tax=Elysia marginata TaxID=1093978 RepID=A0AAV4EIF9_9GAST|nr:endonuclease-reverse transcriptase [Elysia marginata]